VGTGSAFALSAMLAGLPGLAFAVGIYLPLGSLTPIFVGGLVRRAVDARRKATAEEGNPGVLAASGMIAGEGLAGVAIAFLVASRQQLGAGWGEWLSSWHFAEKGFAWITGPLAAVLGVLLVAGISWLLFRAGSTRESPRPTV
jgi:hypothetical protein